MKNTQKSNPFINPEFQNSLIKFSENILIPDVGSLIVLPVVNLIKAEIMVMPKRRIKVV